ncbi:MAG: tryptophan synthase subunit alpha [Parvularculaceae bacterium]|nr:tryptophan synthase subunit alpha [Parvularculaceae bacterium]
MSAALKREFRHESFDRRSRRRRPDACVACGLRASRAGPSLLGPRRGPDGPPREPHRRASRPLLARRPRRSPRPPREPARRSRRPVPARLALTSAFLGGVRALGRSVEVPGPYLPQFRIADRFAALAREGRAAFIPFVMAGDPDYKTSLDLIRALPGAGADLIEIGVAFTDPMADGPAIQAAGLRALKSGQTLVKTLALVEAFRKENDTTPIILMGYYNPIYAMGVERFLARAGAAGVDGLIVVDLPPEEDGELCLPARAAGIDFIRLATPTTDAERLPTVLSQASGFVYYVSVAGVTGGRSGGSDEIAAAVARIKGASGLPVAVGFGVKTASRAAEFARLADAVVVGSALVERIAVNLESNSTKSDAIIHDVLSSARELSAAVRAARG